MEFSASKQILAFAALQAYVEQGLRQLPLPPRRVYVGLNDTDAVSQITFSNHETWVGVSLFSSPVPLHEPRSPSYFTMVHRDIVHQAEGPDTTSVPMNYEFHGDFYASGVAQVGDAIIELLRPEI